MKRINEEKLFETGAARGNLPERGCVVRDQPQQMPRQLNVEFCPAPRDINPLRLVFDTAALLMR